MLHTKLEISHHLFEGCKNQRTCLDTGLELLLFDNKGYDCVQLNVRDRISIYIKTLRLKCNTCNTISTKSIVTCHTFHNLRKVPFTFGWVTSSSSFMDIGYITEPDAFVRDLLR